MTTIRVDHPTGRYITFNTDSGDIIDYDSDATARAVNNVTGDVWSPGLEIQPVTLNHTTGVLCGLAVERAAHFTRDIPAAGWRTWVVHPSGNTTPYAPADYEQLTDLTDA